MGQQQYILDFQSRLNELLSMVAALRSGDVAATCRITLGKLEGAVELLERLCLLYSVRNRIPDDLTSRPLIVEAQVSAIAARVHKRRSVSEKTVRNWTMVAKSLDWIRVEYPSQQFGGPRWNRYEILFANFRTIRQQPPTHGAEMGRKRAETVTDPRAETVTDPNKERVIRDPPPPTPKVTSGCRADDDAWSEVEGLLIECGLVEAARAAALARQAGATPALIGELVTYWRASLAATPHRWKCPEVVLYRRVCSPRPNKRSSDDWPPGSSPEAWSAATVTGRPPSPNTAADRAQRIRESVIRAHRGQSPDALRDLIRAGLLAHKLDPEKFPTALEV